MEGWLEKKTRLLNKRGYYVLDKAHLQCSESKGGKPSKFLNLYGSTVRVQGNMMFISGPNLPHEYTMTALDGLMPKWIAAFKAAPTVLVLDNTTGQSLSSGDSPVSGGTGGRASVDAAARPAVGSSTSSSATSPNSANSTTFVSGPVTRFGQTTATAVRPSVSGTAPRSGSLGHHPPPNGFAGQHSFAFRELLEKYLRVVGDCLDEQFHTADVNIMARSMVDALTDPIGVAKDRLLLENPTASLDRIWWAFDMDCDGKLCLAETQCLVRSYLNAIKDVLPNALDTMLHDILAAFVEEQSVLKVWTELRPAIRDRVLPELNQFFDQLLSESDRIAQEMQVVLDLNRDGRVSRDDFMAAFLDCTQFPQFDMALRSALADEIAAQVTRCLGQMWRATPGHCGLANLGNTCYMNAALQCLSHTVRLRSYLLSEKYKAELNTTDPFGTKGQLTSEFALLIHEMWSRQYQFLKPSKFKKLLDKYGEQFAGWSQQDAHEFVIFLTDKMHNDLNRHTGRRNSIRKKSETDPNPNEPERPDPIAAQDAWDAHIKCNDSIIVDLFHGQLKSQLQCPRCSKKSTTFDVFVGLSVPLPSRGGRLHLNDCMAAFTKQEELGYQDTWKCPVCKKDRQATKTVQLYRLPPYLIIHLKRFGSSTATKLETPVDIPLQGWDISEWIAPAAQADPPQPSVLSSGASVAPTPKGCNSAPNSARRIFSSSPLYDLYAVTDHHGGSINYGHYIAMGRVGEGWYTFDDSNVSPTNPNSFVSRNTSACMLFYRQQDYNAGSNGPLSPGRAMNSSFNNAGMPASVTAPNIVVTNNVSIPMARIIPGVSAGAGSRGGSRSSSPSPVFLQAGGGGVSGGYSYTSGAGASGTVGGTTGGGGGGYSYTSSAHPPTSPSHARPPLSPTNKTAYFPTSATSPSLSPTMRPRMMMPPQPLPQSLGGKESPAAPSPIWHDVIGHTSETTTYF